VALATALCIKSYTIG